MGEAQATSVYPFHVTGGERSRPIRVPSQD
ncbi:hypothetical protein FB460_1183 [Propioniferax innocua]|uniref:Uncharacterized protein n=1 Tax=Propioniferax innocua TaxID=1753 RepID=A0A542ZSP2_9ACTN|nr:hypothetical protein FB460_1183 [Propioniferax innocua]